MAKERKASVIYEGNGTQQTFSFPFDYLRKAFVKAEIIESSGIVELEQGKDYSITDKELTLNSGVSVATGKLLKIYRETTTDPLVEWQDASVLRSADLSLQEVQLLHLAEETADKVFDSGMSTAPTNTNVWDGQYKRITNLLDPQEDGDAVTLRYANDKQHGLLTALKNEGANQNASIVDTGNTQNTRLNTTGDTQNKRLTDTGDAQNSRLISTGDAQNGRLTTTGDSYVETMTTLKADATTQASNATTKAIEAKNSATSASTSASTATTKATEASNSATSASSSASTATTKATEASNSSELAKKWAMSDSSPDGVSGNKSSKTWANEAKNSASSAASSASTATTKANEASNSASAAAKSAENAKTWDPTSYYTKEQTYTKTEVDSKLSESSKILEKVYPVGSIYMNATDSRNPAQIFGFGTWAKISAGRVLLGAGTADSGTVYNAGNTGGKEKESLNLDNIPSHTHSATIGWAGGHTHTLPLGYSSGSKLMLNWQDDYSYAYYRTVNTSSAGDHTHSITINSTGGNTPHNNMQPYLVVYIFKRTA